MRDFDNKLKDEDSLMQSMHLANDEELKVDHGNLNKSQDTKSKSFIEKRYKQNQIPSYVIGRIKQFNYSNKPEETDAKSGASIHYLSVDIDVINVSIF